MAPRLWLMTEIVGIAEVAAVRRVESGSRNDVESSPATTSRARTVSPDSYAISVGKRPERSLMAEGIGEAGSRRLERCMIVRSVQEMSRIAAAGRRKNFMRGALRNR